MSGAVKVRINNRHVSFGVLFSFNTYCFTCRSGVGTSGLQNPLSCKACHSCSFVNWLALPVPCSIGTRLDLVISSHLYVLVHCACAFFQCSWVFYFHFTNTTLSQDLHLSLSCTNRYNNIWGAKKIMLFFFWPGCHTRILWMNTCKREPTKYCIENWKYLLILRA